MPILSCNSRRLGASGANPGDLSPSRVSEAIPTRCQTQVQRGVALCSTVSSRAASGAGALGCYQFVTRLRLENKDGTAPAATQQQTCGPRSAAFICDEYHSFATVGGDDPGEVSGKSGKASGGESGRRRTDHRRDVGDPAAAGEAPHCDADGWRSQAWLPAVRTRRRSGPERRRLRARYCSGWKGWRRCCQGSSLAEPDRSANQDESLRIATARDSHATAGRNRTGDRADLDGPSGGEEERQYRTGGNPPCLRVTGWWTEPGALTMALGFLAQR